MAQNPRFNNSDMFKDVNSNDYSDIAPDSTSEVLATQGNVINSIKVFWNKLKAKLAYAISRPNTDNAVGSHYQPVYIDEHGVVQVCAPKTIVATIESGSNINIGNIPVHPGKTICVRLSGSFGGSATSLKIGSVPVIYPSGAPVYPANVNIDGTYLFTYMAGNGNKWILISNMNVADDNNPGLMTATEHKKLNGIDEGANKYSLPAATSSSLGGVQLGYTTNETNRNYKLQTDNNGNGYVNVPWTDTDTHHTALLKVGGTNSKENQITTNGNTYLQIVEAEANRVTSQHLIKGTKGVTVTSDSNGDITIEGQEKSPTLLTIGSTSNYSINESYLVYGPGEDKANTYYFLAGNGTWQRGTSGGWMEFNKSSNLTYGNNLIFGKLYIKGSSGDNINFTLVTSDGKGHDSTNNVLNVENFWNIKLDTYYPILSLEDENIRPGFIKFSVTINNTVTATIY